MAYSRGYVLYNKIAYVIYIYNHYLFIWQYLLLKRKLYKQNKYFMKDMRRDRLFVAYNIPTMLRHNKNIRH